MKHGRRRFPLAVEAGRIGAAGLVGVTGMVGVMAAALFMLLTGAAFALPGVAAPVAAWSTSPPRSAGAGVRTQSVAPGWQSINLPATGSYFTLYVPASWDQTSPAPLVVFLHGAGGTPEDYEAFVAPAAELVGSVVAAPKSSSDEGWGLGNDDATIAAAAATAEAMLSIDPTKVSIAGHSAGGAYAYLTAYYTVDHYSAVFTLSAPFYQVTAVADPAYKAPIHMYYGTTDPNYTGGSFAQLEQQWTALGVPFETDVETGFGHSNWPPSSMAAGFQFLAAKTYGTTCSADATHLCLQQGRYRVSVTWQDPGGATGPGSVVAGATSTDSGLLWFFDPTNWEMLVKVLDGCAVNQRIWVFSAATTNVQYTLTVADTVTGQVKTYQNGAGQLAGALADTNAFAACP
jgi:predicted esterase